MRNKQLAASAIALSMLTVSVTPMYAANAAAGEIFHTTFEDGMDDWGERSSTVARSTESASAGSYSAAVTGRTDSWNGIARTLSTSDFSAGSSYSFSAMVMQKSGSTVHFKMTLQYGSGMSNIYDTFAEIDAPSGEWVQLANAQYTIPSGAQNCVLYIETDSSTVDFYVDELVAAQGGTVIAPGGNSMGTGDVVPGKGDVNGDGKVNSADAQELAAFLSTKRSSISAAADVDGNGKINVTDLTLLKRLVFNPPVTTTTTTTTTMTTTTTSNPTGGKSPTEYMAEVRKTANASTPGGITSAQSAKGTLTHITYHSQYANRDKGANVWTPAGYSTGKKYPVVYCNHGIMGSENDMPGMGVPEIAANLMAKGEAEEFIIVFPQMYTSKQSANPSGINQQSCVGYDDFVYDIADSLMPYVESHYSVKTGRENTAICGFSMGGRESLYIGLVRADLFGYIGCAAPAPGVTPGQDMFMTHPGCMQESELKFTKDKPYLLMIYGGTNDSVVGTFPEQYHNILTRNGEDHIWVSVPGAGHDGSTVTPLMYHFLKNIFK